MRSSRGEATFSESQRNCSHGHNKQTGPKQLATKVILLEECDKTLLVREGLKRASLYKSKAPANFNSNEIRSLFQSPFHFLCLPPSSRQRVLVN